MEVPMRHLLQDNSTADSSAGPSNELVEAHGALMAVSFVVILPISVIIAATWRGPPNSSAWFQAHRAIGVFAIAAIIVGTALGIVAWQQSMPLIPDILLAHVVIGLIIFCFAVLQTSSALIARPRKGTKLRNWWRPAHQYNGRILLLLGLANTFIGISAAGTDNSWYIWVCSVWVVLIVAGLGKSLYNRRRGPPAAAPESLDPTMPDAANRAGPSTIEML